MPSSSFARTRLRYLRSFCNLARGVSCLSLPSLLALTTARLVNTHLCTIDLGRTRAGSMRCPGVIQPCKANVRVPEMTIKRCEGALICIFRSLTVVSTASSHTQHRNVHLPAVISHRIASQRLETRPSCSECCTASQPQATGWESASL